MLGAATYDTDVDRLVAADLDGFFVGWPDPPSPGRRLDILRAAHRTVIARDASGRVVGFVTAITDGVFAASITLLEVLPDAQHAGIGSELARRVLADLDGCYMVDLTCDADVAPFYERLGATALTAMAWRRYARIDGPS